jgi:Domain of unknown function (DUF1707)
MSRRATLRASDADRERVAEQLRHATAEGRLSPDELEERLEIAFAARTYGELDTLVVDLPGQTVRRRERPERAASAGSGWPGASLWLRPVPIILALFIFGPVLLALMLAAAVIIATVFSAWGVLLVVGWLTFGHSRRHYGAHYRRSVRAATRWQPRHTPRPRSWI